jgi:hypothetical protein
MNIDAFTKSLARAFCRTGVAEGRGAEVRLLRRPRPLAPLLEKSLEGDEEREIYSGTFEDWPGNVAEILEEHGLHRSLITLNWDGFGPVSWSAGAQPRVSLLPQPAQRRRVTRTLPGLHRREPSPSRDRMPLDRTDANGECPLPVRRRGRACKRGAMSDA